MGYYVKIQDSTAFLPKENYGEAYKLMCDLNKDNSLKRGGSYGNGFETPPEVGAHPNIWFSWMDWNYPETCPNAVSILEALGFECSEDDDGIHILCYNSKSGSEDLFLKTIGHLMTGYMVWVGEEGEIWKYEFSESGLIEYEGIVKFVEI
jgi:hypothetical protein